ncbi:caspase family protein [Streptomyces anulatus]|uniref:caspase, EACC1-associated type n=1 Tax=Streptomyces anulatus TaxID=1892 RepID=UPI00386708D9
MTGTRFPERATSRAVLIGAGTFHDPKLPDIPAVQANLDALRRTLTHPVHGVFAPEHCVVVADPKDQATVGAALSRAVRESEDLLLVYYCGHGLLDDDGLLHFALTGTDSQNVSWSAIHLDLVKRMVGGARAKARVLVLDCCFAGKAISAMAGPSALALGQLNLTGTYTLTSTTATAPSHAPPGAAHTAFTGSMLQALTVPGPLTLDEVHRHVDEELAGLGLPRPQQRSVGAVGKLSLVRGPARKPEAPSTTGTSAPAATTDSASPRRLRARNITATIVLSAVALLPPLLGDLLTNSNSSLFGDDEVMIGLESESDNFDMLNPTWGHFSAFSRDVVGALLKEANVESRPIYIDISRQDQMRSLQKREVDLNSALAMTGASMEEVDFVGPIASGRLGFLVRADETTQKILNLYDLDDRTICVQEDSIAALIMDSVDHKKFKVRKMPKFRSCVDSLEKGDIQAIAADNLPLSAWVLENKKFKVVPGLTIGPPSRYGIALPKDHHEDCTRLRDVLMKYVSSGKWLKEFRDRLSNTGLSADELSPTASEIETFSCRG